MREFTLVCSMLTQLDVNVQQVMLRETAGIWMVTRLAPLFCTTFCVFLRVLHGILRGSGTSVRAVHLQESQLWGFAWTKRARDAEFAPGLREIQDDTNTQTSN